jgi:hypothetical protein
MMSDPGGFCEPHTALPDREPEISDGRGWDQIDTWLPPCLRSSLRNSRGVYKHTTPNCDSYSDLKQAPGEVLNMSTRLPHTSAPIPLIRLRMALPAVVPVTFPFSIAALPFPKPHSIPVLGRFDHQMSRYL